MNDPQAVLLKDLVEALNRIHSLIEPIVTEGVGERDDLEKIEEIARVAIARVALSRAL